MVNNFIQGCLVGTPILDYVEKCMFVIVSPLKGQLIIYRLSKSGWTLDVYGDFRRVTLYRSKKPLFAVCIKK